MGIHMMWMANETSLKTASKSIASEVLKYLWLPAAAIYSHPQTTVRPSSPGAPDAIR